MPRLPINYKKTIIYKIVCNDLEITDLYVGHTTNFTDRKRGHKNACSNENSKSYNLKVYKMIRENNGWNNWSMIEIEKYSCNDINEATARERYYYEELNAKLNTYVPNRNRKEWKEDHKDHVLEQDKQYYEQNKEKIKEYHNQYKELNRDKIAKQNKQYYEQNKEKIKEYNDQRSEQRVEYQNQYRYQNRERILEVKARYYNANHERISEERRQKYKLKKEQTTL
jgi:DNA repair exonuclease SbcCD ATPase subunit